MDTSDDLKKFIELFEKEKKLNESETIQIIKNANLSIIKYLYYVNFDLKQIFNAKHLKCNYSTRYCGIIDILAENDKFEELIWLVDKGFDINGTNGIPLRYTCAENNIEGVKMLIAKGANIHIDDEHPFYNACWNGHIELAKWIYSLGGVDIHVNNDTCFLGACYYNKLEMAKWLVSIGANITTNNYEAFRHACFKEHYDIMQWLIDIGIDMNKIDNTISITPISHACHFNKLQLIKWLYNRGANLHDDNDYPLLVSCEIGHFEVVKWLYEKGIDLHIQNEHPFKTACINGHLHIAKWIYEKNNIHYFTLKQVFPIVCANGHLQIAKWFYEINKYTYVPNAFYEACKNNHIHIAQWLNKIRTNELDINPYDEMFKQKCNMDDYEMAKIIFIGRNFILDRKSQQYILIKNMIQIDKANYEGFKMTMYPKIKFMKLFDYNVFEILIPEFLFNYNNVFESL